MPLCDDTTQAAGDAGADRRGGHWTPIGDYDADLLANCQTPQDFALAMGAWYVLLREASYRRALTFNLADGLLAKRLCVSVNTCRKATRLLEGVGLLKSRSGFVPGTKNREPLERTLNPAILPWKTTVAPTPSAEDPMQNLSKPPCAKSEQPLCKKVSKNFAENLTEPSKGSSKKVTLPTVPTAPRATGAGGVRSAQKRPEVIREGVDQGGTPFKQLADGQTIFPYSRNWSDYSEAPK